MTLHTGHLWSHNLYVELAPGFHEDFIGLKLSFIFLATKVITALNISKNLVSFLLYVTAVIPGWVRVKCIWCRGSSDQNYKLSEEDKTKHGVLQETSQPIVYLSYRFLQDNLFLRLEQEKRIILFPRSCN